MGFTCYVEVVGSGASSEAGTFPGVFLFLDNNRYLFGCGEGTQRLLGESRVRFNCIGTVFLTGLSWGEAGGVIGASLTMSEMGNKNVRLMGPIGLADYIQDSASFILKKDLIYNLHEFSSVTLAAHPELGRYTDGVITVVPVPVERSPTTEEATAATTTSSPAPNSCPLPMGRKPLCSMERTIVTATETRLRVKGMDERKEEYAEATGTLQPDEKQPKIESDALSPTYEEYNDGDYSDLMFRSDSVAVSYICHVPDTPGKFLTAKADELGVPKGPDRGRLVHGETIKTPAGRVVRPEECISPVTPGPVFIVVACPDEAHIAGLAASKTFEPYYHTDSEGKVGEMSGRVVCVVHFGPKKVVEHEEYRKWAGRFRSEARNIFVGEGFQATPGRIDFERFGNTQARLSAVSRDLYPLVPVAELDTREEVEALGKLFCNAEVPPRNTRYTFVDGYTARVEAAPESTYNPEKEAAEAAAIVGDIMKVDAKEDSKEEIEVEEEKEKEKHIAKTAPNAFVPLPEDEFRITFMGTGASLPSRHRNGLNK